MYISVEPKTGAYADCYSVDCQEKIKAAHERNDASVCLDKECFNATLFFDRNIPIMQHTPATNFKLMGRRSIKMVSCDDDTVQVFKIPGFGWSLYNSRIAIETKIMEMNKLKLLTCILLKPQENIIIVVTTIIIQ